MYCCGDCIGDRYLRKEIIPSLSTRKGSCSFCGLENVQILEPIELREYFEVLVSIYTPDTKGRPLAAWLEQDWALFDSPRMDGERSEKLLAAILGDEKVVRRRFIPSEASYSNSLQEWDALRRELKHKNRFFPNTGLDLERLSNLLPYLIFDELSEYQPFFRARIHSDSPFSVDEMGAPPEVLASHGRANPAGIPYLYVASTEETAISEIRPHTGERVSVGQFTVPDDLTCLDLRHPRKTVSPFILEDESDVATLRGDISFLDRLGDELTLPVLPRSAAIDYIPSQFLCEFAKKYGFDGVVYRSSVSEGVNLALFDTDMASCVEVTEFLVTRVSISADTNFS